MLLDIFLMVLFLSKNMFLSIYKINSSFILLIVHFSKSQVSAKLQDPITWKIYQVKSQKFEEVQGVLRFR